MSDALGTYIYVRCDEWYYYLQQRHLAVHYCFPRPAIRPIPASCDARPISGASAFLSASPRSALLRLETRPPTRWPITVSTSLSAIVFASFLSSVCDIGIPFRNPSLSPVSKILTEDQIDQVERVARIRQTFAIDAKRKDAYGFDGHHGYEKHFLGAGGECAVALVLGMVWDAGINTFKSADLAGNIQVRTRSKHGYELLVRPDDKDDDIFVHVTCQAFPRFVIHGCLRGREAKQVNWLKDHGGRPAAYFVPNAALLNIQDLIDARIWLASVMPNPAL